MNRDPDATDAIVQRADHIARAGASLDDDDTLRELIAAEPEAAAAARARASKLAADAYSHGERQRWAEVERTITAAAQTSDAS